MRNFVVSMIVVFLVGCEGDVSYKTTYRSSEANAYCSTYGAMNGSGMSQCSNRFQVDQEACRRANFRQCVVRFR